MERQLIKTRERRTLHKLRKHFSKYDGIPTVERIIEYVPYLETHLLTIDEAYENDALLINKLRQHFEKEGRLGEKLALKIIHDVSEVLKGEATLLKLDEPIYICGDIHGQFYDLIKILDIGGMPPKSRYLFLGDYVDRGSFSTEVMLLLFSIKYNCPQSMFLLRGNHECRRLTRHFTFKKECLVKYSQEVYVAFMEAFDCLPLAAVVNNTIICMHGGISPDIQLIDDINHIQRYCETPLAGPMCDLLWADPMPAYEFWRGGINFKPNTARFCSYYFSRAACEDFVARNKLMCVIRAHEVQPEGVRLYGERSNVCPSLMTVFSAPNYLDVYDNNAAILKYEGDTITVRKFNCSPHPYWLPNFENAFDITLPLVAHHVTDMFTALLNICSDEELLVDDVHGIEERRFRRNVIRTKIRAVAAITRMYKMRQEQQKLALNLKGLTPAEPNILNSPVGTDKNLREALKLFEAGERNLEIVSAVDSVNEKVPNSP